MLKLRDSKQVKAGALISYLLIIVNTVYGLIITPYIVTQLTADYFGVYKIVAALSSSLMVLDIGIGSTAIRYIAKFRADKDDSKIPNYIAMCYIQTLVMTFIVVAVSIVFLFSIPQIYSNTLDEAHLSVAKKLFGILIVNMVLHGFENLQAGVISGYNKFIVSNGLKLLRIILRAVLMYVVLMFFRNEQGAYALVLIDLLLTIMLLLIELVYIRNGLGVKVKLVQWDRALFRESLIYTVLMFVQSIVAQINGSLDNIIIGAFISTVAVTIYSYGLQLFNMFEQLAVSLSSVMLPTVSKIIKNDPSPQAMEDIVVRVGKYQFMLVGGALSAFIVLGREFISIWLGPEYNSVWAITLILVASSLLQLVQNVCLAILRAKNLMLFKTVITCIMAALNMVLTIWFVKSTNNYVTAAYGTAAGYILANTIAMNIYYWKKLRINFFRMQYRIMKGSVIPLVIAGVSTWRFTFVLTTQNWVCFAIKASVFIAVYVLMLILFNAEFRGSMQSFIQKSCK